MESDLVSLLFHCFLIENPEIINKIHSDTRVFNANGLHIDLVIGEITLESKRQSVIPELLIECKIFGNGFISSQLSKRFVYLKDDLFKINNIKHKVPKFILLYDYCNYLNNAKTEELLEIRNTLDNQIEIILINKTDKFNYKII